MVADTEETEEAAELTWEPGTVQVTARGATHTLPCQRGVSADGLTAVEIVGDDETVLAVTLVGILTSENEAATRRNAAYASGLLQKAIPGWNGGQKWLADRIRALRTQPRAANRVHGWSLLLTFEPKTAMMTFRVTR